MLCRLEIDNFKTLNQFQMELSPLTVVVGNNASGKSTILQVLDLLCSSVQEDFSSILVRRGWNVSDLRSKCRNRPSSRLVISADFYLAVEGEQRRLRWELVLQYAVQKNILSLYSEKVSDLERDQVYLEYTDKGVCMFQAHQETVRFPRLSSDASVLKVAVDDKRDQMEYPELAFLKRYLLGIRSFELLSPDQMRSSSRGKSANLSVSGKNLPSFLKNLSDAQKVLFLEKLHRLLGGRIEDVTTETKGKPGWTYVNVTEKYNNLRYTISSRHLSDGMLRLLAFIGLSESEDGTLLLLDEIENGINSSYAEELMHIFYEMSKNGRQLLTTTHNVVFLDYVEKEDIIYLYRDEKTGETIAAKIFELPELQEKLEYMYPGEIIYNTSNQKLIELCLTSRQ
ncbi:MAG: ATP-binding protein [Lachnospiraceae bacterium]|nr:ATP-binding protein [Lachnospiraceae bacterium]